MKSILLLVSLIAFVQPGPWHLKKEKAYSVYYREADKKDLADYNKLFKKGTGEVKSFFKSDFNKHFRVYIHPHRKSLDSSWQKDWNMPDFKSECWMVASGMASRVDLISPAVWKQESCEHDYRDKTETQRLITHELVHVYHAQRNPSPDFSELAGLDWFAEGLANYASGQLTIEKLETVRRAIRENKIPSSLDDFWKGPIRYQLSGSVIRYIDNKWGREKLITLLSGISKTELLSALSISEVQLIRDWKKDLVPEL